MQRCWNNDLRCEDGLGVISRKVLKSLHLDAAVCPRKIWLNNCVLPALKLVYVLLLNLVEYLCT